MRRSLALILTLAAAACGQPAQQEGEAYRSGDSDAVAPASMRAEAGPDVAPTAAPGVAFDYRYAFRLPAERIAEVQERHARMCESLGIARCRITGMRYRVVNARDIEGMLVFRLHPAIARRFGRAGVEAVAEADGMLTDAEISGTDVGGAIARGGRDLAAMREDLRRLESRLARRDLPAEERSRLEYEAGQLRQSIRAAEATRGEQQESLATTPMTFRYGSGDLVPGFDSRPSFGRALERAADNLIDSVYIPSEKPGTVLRQDPEPATKVKHNRTVYLYVTGMVPPQIEMPKLLDRSERQARLIITTYGLKVGSVKEEEAYCNGCVLAQQIKGQDIEPGTPVKKGSVIDLVVGRKDSYLGEHENDTTGTR